MTVYNVNAFYVLIIKHLIILDQKVARVSENHCLYEASLLFYRFINQCNFLC